jgi:riboflavin biosynthesis pyrimidine reductase
VRQVFPDVCDLDDGGLRKVYAHPRGRGARLNMIASVDGASSAGGLSGALGSPADRHLFLLLRTLCDVVLVGAGTVRAENYGPARVPVAVVSRRCLLDWDGRLFQPKPGSARPIVLTVAAAPEEQRRAAEKVADVIVAGDTDVDLGHAFVELRERGLDRVLCEGGPTLNTHLAHAGLVDELCLTIAPMILGGDAVRIFTGGFVEPIVRMHLRAVCEEEGFLFLRYTRG